VIGDWEGKREKRSKRVKKRKEEKLYDMNDDDMGIYWVQVWA